MVMYLYICIYIYICLQRDLWCRWTQHHAPTPQMIWLYIYLILIFSLAKNLFNKIIIIYTNLKFVIFFGWHISLVFLCPDVFFFLLGGLYKENQSQSPMITSCDAKKKILKEGQDDCIMIIQTQCCLICSPWSKSVLVCNRHGCRKQGTRAEGWQHP